VSRLHLYGYKWLPPDGYAPVTGPPPGEDTTVPLVAARQASDVTNQFGMNVHSNYTGTLYTNTYMNSAKIAGLLNDLGCKHIRDNVAPSGQTQQNNFHQMMLDSGIKILSTFVIGNTNAEVDALIGRINTYYGGTAGGRIEMIEGPNEPDIFGNASTWATVAPALQKYIYNKVQSVPAVADIPVLSPALGNAATSRAAMGDLTAWTDNGAIHGYLGGSPPNRYLPGGVAQQLLALQAQMTTTRKSYWTETGGHDCQFAKYQTGAKAGTNDGHIWTPPDLGAIYYPKMLFEHMKNGILRTYFYEIIDQDSSHPSNKERHFGFYYTDGSPKPYATAMKNLMTLFSDPGSSFTPSGMRYKITGGGADFNHILFEKRNGDNYLVFWRSVNKWNPVNQGDYIPLTVAPSNITVTLGSSTNMSEYNTRISASTPRRTLSNVTSFTASIAEDLMVYKLV
jgi:hypothetical protein